MMAIAAKAGAFEFEHRTVTAVEDDLLAWYPMDDFSREVISDLSGRMRHGTYVGFDATDLSTGIVSQSGQVGAHAGTRAFDNLTTANNSHCWRAPAGICLRHGSYEFPSPVEIIDYSILPVPINNNLDNRSPGDWRFKRRTTMELGSTFMW